MTAVPAAPVKAKRCPACGVEALLPHCEDHDCGWEHCTNVKCDLVFDRTNARGHYIDSDSVLPKRRNFP